MSKFLNGKRELDNIVNGYAKYIILIAPVGYGKTDLLEESIEYFKDKKYTTLDYDITKKTSLDNLTDYLDKKLETCKISETRLYLALDNIEQNIDVVQEFIENLSLDEFKDTKILLTTYKFQKLKLGRKFTTRIMKPFDIEVIQDALRDDIKNKNIILDDFEREKIANHIMYITGGHPLILEQCFDKIDYNNLEEFFSENFLSEYIFTEINKMKTPPIMSIISTLSPIRKINWDILTKLHEKKLIKTNENILKLHKQLKDTKIFVEKDTFLQDDVTRRVFSIDRRQSEQNKFLDIIKEVENIYSTTLKNGKSNRLDIIAVEQLFLYLERLIIERSKLEKLKKLISLDKKKKYIQNFIDNIFKQFEEIDTSDNKLELKELFLEKLSVDIEIDFLMNYYFNRDENNYQDYYKDFLKQLNKRIVVCQEI